MVGAIAYLQDKKSVLIYDISQYTEPIRPGRKDKRNLRSKRFAGFIYRVAA